MDITTPPLPPVAPEVLRVAEHRHKKGLMYPYIFHVLTKVCAVVTPGVWLLALGTVFLSSKLFETKFIFPFLNFEENDENLYL